MHPKDQVIAAAWVEAGRDLGITVKSPFVVRLAAREFTVAAYVPNFGRDKGAVFIAVESEQEDLRAQAATAAGYFVAHLKVELFGQYSRQHFSEMLSDMGWFGPAAEKPAWCEG